MRIRYHFIANLHITETRSILLLPKYDKTTLQDKLNQIQKQVFTLNG